MCFRLVTLHSIGTVLFYALGISLVAVGIHGAMRVPDDLFLDEPEVSGGCISPRACVTVAHSRARAFCPSSTCHPPWRWARLRPWQQLCNAQPSFHVNTVRASFIVISSAQLCAE